MAHSTQARGLLYRRALLISGAVGLASTALPGRGLTETAFVLPSDSANRRFSVLYKGDQIGTHTAVFEDFDDFRRLDPVLCVLKANISCPAKP